MNEFAQKMPVCVEKNQTIVKFRRSSSSCGVKTASHVVDKQTVEALVKSKISQPKPSLTHQTTASE
jgi:hypothetical protein